ncbi:hypothetical protein NMG60_11015196 [Bertholletia excelsa]
MEIPLSRYQNLSLDQIQSSCKFPCSLPGLNFREKPLFSGYCLFSGGKWTTQISKIRCCFVAQGLKPRPVPKPSKIEINIEKEETHLEVAEVRVLSSGLCTQIEKLVLYGRYQEAFELFEILESEGDYEVSDGTYDALVNACIGLKSVRGVKRVFNHMINNGFEPDQYMSNRVLLMHVKLDSGDYIEAFRLFLIMWAKFSDAGSRTFAVMICAAAGLELVFPGKQLHSCGLKMGFGGNIFISCALIDMYSKCGSVEDAQCVFDEMPKKTTVGWNSIIAGYALHGYSKEALNMYYEMRDSGVKMDHFTFSIIVRVCARLASVEHAKQAHAGLVRHGFGLDIVANTAFVDFYSKWGRIEDARNVFEKMPQKNVISWNALIAGCGNHGQGIEAVELFERMLHEGMVPNHVTFLAVLSACSYSGLSDCGWEIFESMSRDHQVKPWAMHYACMIELLGREGLLDEAFALIQDAPFPPTVNMWAALLTACRVQKNLVLGKLAAEKIYGMEPEKLSNYVVLLIIYNKNGMMKEAAGVVQTLRKRGLRMLPACTWIDIKKQTHSFLSGNKNQVQKKEIYQKVDNLMEEISKHGYVSGEKFLLPDVDEQEQGMVLYHSEKLAIAFGLINTPPSTALQLVQSHRICDDCHNAVKLITTVSGREFIVRDASRFHRFKDGKCSCGDYW